MRAGFPDAAVVQDDDPVCILHGGKAMRDDDRRAVSHQLFKRIANQHLRFRVDAGGRFVQNQDFRVVGQGARKGKQLFLPHRKRGAPFSDFGCIAMLQFPDETGCMNRFRRPLHVFIGDVFVSQTYVFCNASRKQKHVLKHDADGTAQLLQVEILYVLSIDQDLALLDIVETAQQ